jgi:hypothetical protein
MYLTNRFSEDPGPPICEPRVYVVIVTTICEHIIVCSSRKK